MSGDTIDWDYNADQSINTDICNACWMSAAWEDYDSEMYSDSLLSQSISPTAVGYLDGEDTTSVSLMRNELINLSTF